MPKVFAEAEKGGKVRIRPKNQQEIQRQAAFFHHVHSLGIADNHADQGKKATEAHVRQLRDGKAAREERNALLRAQAGTNRTATNGNETKKSEDKVYEMHKAGQKPSDVGT